MSYVQSGRVYRPILGGKAKSLLRPRNLRSISANQGVFGTIYADLEHLQRQIVPTKYLLCFPPSKPFSRHPFVPTDLHRHARLSVG
jgi:hypothetical protein